MSRPRVPYCTTDLLFETSASISLSCQAPGQASCHRGYFVQTWKAYVALSEPAVLWFMVEVNLLTKIKLFCYKVFVVIPHNWSIINFRTNLLTVPINIFDLQLLYLKQLHRLVFSYFPRRTRCGHVWRLWLHMRKNLLQQKWRTQLLTRYAFLPHKTSKNVKISSVPVKVNKNDIHYGNLLN